MIGICRTEILRCILKEMTFDISSCVEVKDSNIVTEKSPKFLRVRLLLELPVGVSSAVDVNTATTTHAITA